MWEAPASAHNVFFPCVIYSYKHKKDLSPRVVSLTTARQYENLWDWPKGGNPPPFLPSPPPPAAPCEG